MKSVSLVIIMVSIICFLKAASHHCSFNPLTTVAWYILGIVFAISGVSMYKEKSEGFDGW